MDLINEVLDIAQIETGKLNLSIEPVAVDDVIRAATTLILDQVPNVELLTAMQGRLGFELAVEHQPDLVLLDVHLPDLNGDQVLTLLRNHGSLGSTRVVFLSADATPKHIERLLEAGCDGYLTKPFDLTQLLDEVETARAAVPA